MKRNKSILLFVLLCCAAMVSAQSTVTMQITAILNGRNGSVFMDEQSTYSATTQERNESSLNPQGFPNLNIYAVAPYGNMTSFCTNDLVGTKFSFTTNQSQEYKLTFSGQTGDVQWLHDMKTGKTFSMTASTEYTFQIDGDQVTDVAERNNPKVVENRFEIVSVPAEYEICYRNQILSVSLYPATANNPILVKDETGTLVKSLTVTNFSTQDFDLSSLTTGHYTIEANGETLTIGVK